MNRVNFCGVIEGAVTIREGETVAEALSRAEATLCALLDSRARSLGNVEGCGPNVGLELA